VKVRELIAELRKLPPEMEVEVWDDAEDEFVPVVQALWESGTSAVHLQTIYSEVVEAPPSDPG
jgi:hypothetical protein